MDDAAVPAQHSPVEIDDIAGLGGAGFEPLDDVRVAARRHETDVLAVVLVGDRKAETAGKLPRLPLCLVAQRKPQHLELLARGGKQEIALVALFLAGAIERAASCGQRTRGHVVAGRQHLGAEFARGCQEIAELDRLVAIDARHRRLARDIARGKAVDDRLLEPALVIEDVVRDPDPLRHRSRIVNVLTGAAGTLAVGRCTVIVELQRHANDVIALGLEQCRRDRGIHAARHGDHDAGVARGTVEVEAVEHCVFRRAFPAPYYRHSIGASHARKPPDLRA